MKKKERRGREDEPRGDSSDVLEDLEDGRTPDGPREGPDTVGAGDAADRRIAELEEEVEGLRAKHLRALADLDNVRKRSEREKADLRRFACESLILDLLEVLDGFDRAVALDPGAVAGGGFLEGVDLLRQRFLELLGKAGVAEIEAVGRPFDPHVHEAVTQVDAEGAPSGTVVEEFRKGYRLHDRLLRPSKVSVAE